MDVFEAAAFALLVAAAGFLHALGHLVGGLAVGARVEEFSLGIGPCLGTFGPLSFRLLPLWAYVVFEGQVEEGAYHVLPPARRLVLTLAGPLANLLASVVLLAAVGVGWGRLVAGDLDNVVYQVLPGSPAAVAGLQPGDAVIQVDGEPWVSLETFQEAAGRNRPLVLLVERDGATLPMSVRPLPRVLRVGMKVRPALGFEPLDWGEVPPYSLRTALAMAAAPFRLGEWRAQGLLRLPDGGILVGPSGWKTLERAGWLVGLAVVNAWLAMMMALPIPGTDGMRMLIQAAQRAGLAVPTAAEEHLTSYGVWAFGTAYALILMIIAATR